MGVLPRPLYLAVCAAAGFVLRVRAVFRARILADVRDDIRKASGRA